MDGSYASRINLAVSYGLPTDVLLGSDRVLSCQPLFINGKNPYLKLSRHFPLLIAGNRPTVRSSLLSSNTSVLTFSLVTVIWPNSSQPPSLKCVMCCHPYWEVAAPAPRIVIICLRITVLKHVMKPMKNDGMSFSTTNRTKCLSHDPPSPTQTPHSPPRIYDALLVRYLDVVTNP